MVDRSFSVAFTHRLRFTRDVFDPANQVLDDVIRADDPSPTPVVPRVLFVLDAGLDAADPGLRERLSRYVASRRGVIDAAPAPLLIPGGEIAKNDPRVLEQLLHAMQNAGICRRSYVIVIGGGAVLDVAGYAASIFHRGVRLIRIPSTTLAQDDSGVGVKSGVNAMGLKNLVGAFWPPRAVINDESLLRTLTDEHWRSGFSEAVKVALLKDADFFAHIERDAARVHDRGFDAAVPIIRRSALLHLDHITSGGDPFEFLTARPLDFGHWAAHKLEQMTNFALTHGHAVGIGMMIDCRYAQLMGLCEDSLPARVYDCLTRLGLPTSHPMLARADDVLAGLEQFREHLGGRLTITLVRTPGHPYDVHEIDHQVMRRAILGLAEQA